MTIANVTESAVLRLFFNGTAIANVADNAVASPITTVGISLAIADPTDTGNMGTNEATYTGYVRLAINRSATSGGSPPNGWTETGGSVSPNANIDFGLWTGGSATAISNFSVGMPGGGAVNAWWQGTVSPSITMGAGVQPSLTTATVITLD
jgi:hypothetical protein